MDTRVKLGLLDKWLVLQPCVCHCETIEINWALSRGRQRERRAQPKKGVISLAGRHEMVGQTDLSSGVMYCCQLGHFGDSLKKPQGKWGWGKYYLSGHEYKLCWILCFLGESLIRSHLHAGMAVVSASTFPFQFLFHWLALTRRMSFLVSESLKLYLFCSFSFFFLYQVFNFRKFSRSSFLNINVFSGHSK